MLLKYPHDDRDLDGRKDYMWLLSNVPRLTKDSLWAVKDEDRRRVVKEIVEAFRAEVVLAKLECAVIHGDVNEQNVLVDQKEGNVCGIIDFGDCAVGPVVFDVAIAIMYMMVLWWRGNDDMKRCLAAGGHVLAGYLSERRLSETELRVLPTSVVARFAQSLTLCEVTTAKDPSNEYVRTVAKAGGWEVMKAMWDTPKEEIMRCWREVAASYGQSF